MWTPSAAQDGWPPGMEALDFGSPLGSAAMCGTPMGTPMAASMGPLPLMSGMGGVLPPFPPLPPMPFHDINHTCQLAPHLEMFVQQLAGRVQKLERSRGQISKDISDMQNETHELLKRVHTVEPWKEARPAPFSVHEAPACSMIREETSTDFSSSLGVSRRLGRMKTAPAPSSKPEGENLTVQLKELNGRQVERVEWRIDNVKAKLKENVGRPLVSPQFKAAGLQELKLLVSATAESSSLTMREQKSRFEARVAEGPLNGSLSFKVINQAEVHFNLFIGGVKKGPLVHNFAERIMHTTDFPENWLGLISNGSMTVGVEILHVEDQSGGARHADDGLPARAGAFQALPYRVENEANEWDQMSKEIHKVVLEGVEQDA